MREIEINLPKTSTLERMGLKYFQARTQRYPGYECEDAVHILNEKEQRQLLRIERLAMARAFLAGALSGLVTLLASWIAWPMLGANPDLAEGQQLFRFSALVWTATGVATLFELWFLYWDSLRSVHRLSYTAGVCLFNSPNRHEEMEVASALARAALELPNPPHIFPGVNPFRETSRIKIFLFSVFYRIKVGLTNFLAKALLRRFLGRSVARLALEALAIPITGIWDAWVVRAVLREARIRVMGPSAISELLPQILPPEFTPTPSGEIALFRAVGSAIVRTADMHPNLLLLLKKLHQVLGSPGEENIDQSGLFLTELPNLSDQEKEVVLKLLALAAIIDGRLVRREKKLLEEAWGACVKEFDLKLIRDLRNNFVRGNPIKSLRLF